VKAEVRLKSFPQADWVFGILAGIEEVASLLEGSGQRLGHGRGNPVRAHEPCSSSRARTSIGPSTRRRSRLLCRPRHRDQGGPLQARGRERQVISFGARRMHPGSPHDRAECLRRGCDGVAVTKSAELSTPIPRHHSHALVLLFVTRAGLQAFHDVVDAKVRRVASSTHSRTRSSRPSASPRPWQDLYAVRLDTPSRDAGLLPDPLGGALELDIRGFEHVKILPRGIDEYEILKLNPLVDVTASAPPSPFPRASRLDLWRSRAAHAKRASGRGKAGLALPARGNVVCGRQARAADRMDGREGS